MKSIKKTNSPKQSESKKNLREKLSTAIKDSLSLGCLRGFEYFDLFSRGKEELVITIQKQHTISRNGPRDANQEGSYLFLLGSYQKYRSPFVWTLFDQAESILPPNIYIPPPPTASEPSSSQNTSSPNPLKNSVANEFPLNLETTLLWGNQDVRLWQIIHELLRVVIKPPKKNLFQIDFNYIMSLPAMEQSLSCASLISFLRGVIEDLTKPKIARAMSLQNLDQTIDLESIFLDLERLTYQHFYCLSLMFEEPNISYNESDEREQ